MAGWRGEVLEHHHLALAVFVDRERACAHLDSVEMCRETREGDLTIGEQGTTGICNPGFLVRTPRALHGVQSGSLLSPVNHLKFMFTSHPWAVRTRPCQHTPDRPVTAPLHVITDRPVPACASRRISSRSARQRHRAAPDAPTTTSVPARTPRRRLLLLSARSSRCTVHTINLPHPKLSVRA
jgi:hypothetical protein